MNRVRRSLAGLLLAAAAGGVPAQAFDTAALQRLLQDTPRQPVRFTETRESPWLDAPTQASGTMRMQDGVLEKRVERPRRETWRILPDRMQQVPEAAPPREIRFADVPAMAALAHALRSTLSGDLQALERDFKPTLAGQPQQWTLQLTPRRPEVAKSLKLLELRGTRGRVQAIEIVESRGERTTTQLIHD
jgi:hypothetical protein